MTNFATTSTKPLTEPTPTKSRGVKVLTGLIVLYQRLRVGRVSPCRFYPSCSNYALEAVEVHGVARGSLLALRRLLRCRPFGPHGIDLVPEPKQSRSSLSCTH
ncbi:MAG TPA: membrane protein insertion efficiency factor YidD [Acidimicrobiales bacterium]|nr:membrane protein insertion efficiency factor YidD [Acidimicrobiales bacterium]